MSTLIAAAKALAHIAHLGVGDKSDEPYIHHPTRVAAAVQVAGGTDEQVAAAWLHDVLEDTKVTETDMRAAGIPETVVRYVKQLTRTKDQHSDDYYAAIVYTPALLIKAADIMDNLDARRLAKLPPETQVRLVKKYAEALDKLGLKGSPLTWRLT